jgi:hypothetical protein
MPPQKTVYEEAILKMAASKPKNVKLETLLVELHTLLKLAAFISIFKFEHLKRKTAVHCAY